jgi:hypothetical protein
VGHGSSKRQAKSAAARASIHILIPEMKDDLDQPSNKEPDFSVRLAHVIVCYRFSLQDFR